MGGGGEISVLPWQKIIRYTANPMTFIIFEVKIVFFIFVQINGFWLFLMYCSVIIKLKLSY